MKNVAYQLFSIFFFLLATSTQAQTIVQKIHLSLDTVYMGNFFEVHYVEENINSDYTNLSFDDFEVISGPNHMASTTILNGEISSSRRTTYRLLPLKSGVYKLPSMSHYDESGQLVSSVERQVVVLENPDGIQQHNQLENWKNDLMMTPKMFKKKGGEKKKRKLIRI